METILNTASNLNLIEFYNFLDLHKDVLVRDEKLWQEIIRRKYGFTLSNASEDDYLILDILINDGTKFILGTADVFDEINKILSRNLMELKAVAKAEEMIYTPISEATTNWVWGSSLGLFVKAKSALEATLLLMDANPDFRDTVTKNFILGYMRVELEARERYKSSLLILDLLDRIEDSTETNLPKREDISASLEEDKVEGFIGEEDKFTEFFVYFVSEMEFFNVYPHVKLLN